VGGLFGNQGGWCHSRLRIDLQQEKLLAVEAEIGPRHATAAQRRARPRRQPQGIVVDVGVDRRRQDVF
jgi:hypothetical protein